MIDLDSVLDWIETAESWELQDVQRVIDRELVGREESA